MTFFSRRYRLLPILAALLGLAVPQLRAQDLVHVPGDQPDLSSAIAAVNDGGIIEYSAGTYSAPSGGFTIYDMPTPKTFTVRAAAGAAVTLTGNGSTDILRIAPSSLDAARPITFEGITFTNGHSQTNFIGGGMTLVNAKGTFWPAPATIRR